MTHIRLPNFFLLDFNLVQHPETGEPWWVPRTLLEQVNQHESSSYTNEGGMSEPMREGKGKKGEATAEREQQDQQRQDAALATPTDDNSNDDDVENKAPPIATFSHENANTNDIITTTPPDDKRGTEGTRRREKGEGGEKDGQSYGPSAYILARQDVLASLGATGRQRPSSTHTLIAGRRLFGASSSRYRTALSARGVVLREDAHARVLDLLRRAAADQLLYLAALCRGGARGYVVPCRDGWDNVEFRSNGALLWFRDADADAGAEADTAESGDTAEDGDGGDGGGGGGGGMRERMEKKGWEPGLLATLDTQICSRLGQLQPTTVPVHNMPMLLGEELAARVRRDACGVFDDAGDGDGDGDDGVAPGHEDGEEKQEPQKQRRRKQYGALFMLASRRTADLQAALWRLQGYLADFGEMPHG